MMPAVTRPAGVVRSVALSRPRLPRRSFSVAFSAVHFGVSGAGPRAWFGWPDVPELEKLITEWVRAPDEAKRLRLADEVQRVALSEVTYVPWGQWLQPTASRRSVRDVPKFLAPSFWNVKLV